MKKQALCVGINYAGTEFALRGCLNDADDWTNLLTAHAFSVQQLKESQATRANILHGLTTLVSGLNAGDVGVFTYSGHGTWLPDKDGDEPDGRDEALCPHDMGRDGSNLIIDDELAVVFSKLVLDASLVVIADCCHSGTIYRALPFEKPTGLDHRVRMIPPTKFTWDSRALERFTLAEGTSVKTNLALGGVVHFSGCRDSETSADADIAGRPCGAFSYWATKAFGRATAIGSTYAEVYADIRKQLPNQDFSQTPQLNATKAMRRAKVFQ